MALQFDSPSVFVLSIEPVEGETYQHGYHLGTDVALARKIAAEEFHRLNATGTWTRTVGLIRDAKLVDVYDGAWSSQSQDWD